MKVNLVSVSKPIAEGLRTAEDLMVYCARVSNPTNRLVLDTGPRLLRYCVKHGHWSVFEMAGMTLELETSRAIAAQILRHRSFNFQEFSQRYAEPTTSFEYVEARLQGQTNRQVGDVVAPEDVGHWFEEAQCRVEEFTTSLYFDALERGVAREQARFLLPLGTQTTLYMNGSVRSWIHYLQARLSPHAQKEHRELAEKAAEIFKEQFPVTYEAVFQDAV